MKNCWKYLYLSYENLNNYKHCHCGCIFQSHKASEINSMCQCVNFNINCSLSLEMSFHKKQLSEWEIREGNNFHRGTDPLNSILPWMATITSRNRNETSDQCKHLKLFIDVRYSLFSVFQFPNFTIAPNHYLNRLLSTFSWLIAFWYLEPWAIFRRLILSNPSQWIVILIALIIFSKGMNALCTFL